LAASGTLIVLVFSVANTLAFMLASPSLTAASCAAITTALLVLALPIR
jgi:hypothetical protein